MSGRYDQIEGADYGVCVDCGLALVTEKAATEHRAETLAMARDSRSHRTRAGNPTRAQRIQSRVDSAVESAISDALDDLQGDVDAGHLTEAEVVEALNRYTAFLDEWNRGNS